MLRNQVCLFERCLLAACCEDATCGKRMFCEMQTQPLQLDVGLQV